MKNIALSTIVLLLFAGACGNEQNDKSKMNDRWVWFVDKATHEGRWIPVGQKSPLTGEYTAYYYNGIVSEKGTVHEGHQVDTTFYYNMQGEYDAFTIWHDGKPDFHVLKDGPFKSFHRNGKPYVVAEITDHYPKTRYTRYSENGNMEVSYFFPNDTSGWQVDYYPNGNKKDTAIQNNKGEMVPIASWYENGARKYEDIRTSTESGVQRTFHENGKLIREGSYNSLGLDGVSREWYDNGTLHSFTAYKNGRKDGPMKSFYTNGIVHRVGFCKNDLPDGEWKEYDETGKLIQTMVFSNGERIK